MTVHNLKQSSSYIPFHRVKRIPADGKSEWCLGKKFFAPIVSSVIKLIGVLPLGLVSLVCHGFKWVRETKQPDLTDALTKQRKSELEKVITAMKERGSETIEKDRELLDKTTKSMKSKFSNLKRRDRTQLRHVARMVKRAYAREGLELTLEQKKIEKKLKNYYITIGKEKLGLKPPLLNKIKPAYFLHLGMQYPLTKKDLITLFSIKEVNKLDLHLLQEEIKQGPYSMDPSKVDAEVEKYENALKELLNACTKEENDPQKQVKEIISALRKAQGCEAYQALKTDSTDKGIQLLHTLAAAFFTEPVIMDSFKELGKVITEQAQKESEASATGSSSFFSTLNKTAEYAKKKLFHNKQAGFFLTHWCIAFTNLASKGSSAEWVAGDVYDNRTIRGRSNNPSGAADMTSDYDKTQLKVRNLYTASPTSGNCVQPEFRLFLQAAENEQFKKKRDEKIPNSVTYTNLQNLSNRAEGARSRALMSLNKEYPLSFQGITLTKDSDFYDRSESLFYPKQNQVPWENPEKFGEDFKEQLLEQSSFSLDDARKFYFPGGKQAWKDLIERVISHTTTHFKRIKEDEINLAVNQELQEITKKEVAHILKSASEEEVEATFQKCKTPSIDLQDENYNQVFNSVKTQMMRSAYQECAYSLIQVGFEKRVAKNLSDRGLKVPYVGAIRACKESIDRGGAENAKLTYLQMEDEEGKEHYVTGAMHGRSLSSTDRIVLRHRINPFLHLVNLVKPERYREMQSTFLKECLDISDFKFALRTSHSEELKLLSSTFEGELEAFRRDIKFCRNTQEGVKKADGDANDEPLPATFFEYVIKYNKKKKQKR